jgi:uncharacterized membrane protein YqjE
MSAPAGPEGDGSEGSMREAGAALVGLVGTRIELLGVELREEAAHFQRMLVRGVVAAFLLGGALILAGVTIAAAFWDTHRLLALGAVTLLYAVLAAAVLMGIRSSFLERPAPFDATVKEFEADLQALREPARREQP